MTGKVSKASFRSKESDILYKSVIKKSVMFFGMVLFISLGVMLYFTADLYAQYCIEKIKRLESVTENGLRDFMITQKKQISCFKKRISNAPKLNDFATLLANCSILHIDKFLIDYNGKVLFNSNKTNNNIPSHFDREQLGFSLEKLKDNPENIIIGNIIEDETLKRNYFFIASGVSNKNSNFTAILLLKIDINYLNEKIVPLNNRILKINDTVDKALLDNPVYQQLQEFPAITFLSNTLFHKSDLNIISYNNNFQKYTESIYNSKRIAVSFIDNVFIFGCIIFTLLIFVFFIYWKMILLPMKESLMMVQKNNNGRREIDKLFSIFYRLNDFNLDQSALISKQEQEQREQFAKIISIIFSIGSLAQYVTSKVEILKEDIADIRAKSNKKLSSEVDFSKRLSEIEKTVASSGKDIKLLTSEYAKFTKLIKTQKRENIIISSSILDSLINVKIAFMNKHQTVKITPQIEFKIHVYKSFFMMLLDEILNFNNNEITLTEIIIYRKQKLQFIFNKINSNFINLQNEQITVSKMLGMFNDIKVSILQDQESVTIDLNFNL